MENKDNHTEIQSLLRVLPAEQQRDLLELARAAKAVEGFMCGNIHPPHEEG